MNTGIKKFGLALSGGGIKGIAHIGLIKALEEYNINVEIVSGASAGALVGALYSNGCTVDEMLTFFKETPLLKYNYLTLIKPGIVNTEKYHQVFKQYFPIDSFESLPKKLFVSATNLQTGKLDTFSSGELIKPLLASAALPPVFSPVTINDYLYADGGILNNFPIEPLLGNCEVLIGSNVSVIKEIPKTAINNSIKLTNRVTALMVDASNRIKLKQCQLVFEPQNLDKIGLLDKKAITTAFDIGYEHALSVLDKTVKGLK